MSFTFGNFLNFTVIMVRYLKIVLSFILVLSFVTDVFCLRCWTCKSLYDTKCGDPFDNTTMAITDCTQLKEFDHLPGARSTMCRKIRQKVNGEWRYFRDCAYLGEVGVKGDEKFCLMRTGTYNNIFMEYCTCNSKDGCNSSGTISPVTFMVLISVISIYVKILS